MKQIVQLYSSGHIGIWDVPIPLVPRKGLLVRTHRSVISAGTERSMIQLARKSLIQKAISRPDLVKQVIDKVKTEGLQEAYIQSRSRLDTPVPLGYSCAGEVIEVGDGAHGFSVGDRVACLGHPHASHAEVVAIPLNLACRIPELVDFDEAAFVGLGAIGLHSVREAKTGVGDRVAVIGLGLLGLITTQILRAAGARVLGFDVEAARCKLAVDLGAEKTIDLRSMDPVQAAYEFTEGIGVDAALIFAATASNGPVELAADIARPRARIIATGAIGLDLPREKFYHKELEVVIPRSWGPGAEDQEYERKGVDYPIQYVRWTQQRNMEAFLDLVATKLISLSPLVTHRYPFEQALEAYQLVTAERPHPHIGVILEYPIEATQDRRLKLATHQWAKPLLHSSGRSQPIRVGVVGGGLFGRTVLIPTLRRSGQFTLEGLATATGVSAAHVGRRFGFRYVTTDYHELLSDAGIDLVFVLTRHDLHARIVCEALEKGKHVFVEKPLAISPSELSQVQQCAMQHRQVLMVGFNRRYSPHSIEAKKYLDRTSGPSSIICRVNAGPVPANSWVQNEQEGAGRIIGEVCHFIDLLQYLTGANVLEVSASAISPEPGRIPEDTHITLRFEDGSVGTIVYSARGNKAFPRERVEIMKGGAVCLLDNFRRMVYSGPSGRHFRKTLGVDRGYRTEISVLASAVGDGNSSASSLDSYVCTTLATFAVEQAMQRKTVVSL